MDDKGERRVEAHSVSDLMKKAEPTLQFIWAWFCHQLEEFINHDASLCVNEHHINDLHIVHLEQVSFKFSRAIDSHHDLKPFASTMLLDVRDVILESNTVVSVMRKLLLKREEILRG